MKAAVFMEPGKMAVHEVDKPTIHKSTDAILKIVRACLAGFDGNCMNQEADSNGGYQGESLQLLLMTAKFC